VKADVFDLVALAGVAALGVGLWRLSPSLALVALGSIALAFGVWGSVARTRHRNTGEPGGG